MSSRIINEVRDVMRRRRYSIRTERSYCAWIKRLCASLQHEVPRRSVRWREEN